MYRYLDRSIDTLTGRDRFLLFAMRDWVRAIGSGRCNCGALQSAFRDRGIAEAASDFGILMTTLNFDGLEKLRFGSRCSATVTSDEARVLALFATADSGPLLRLKRVAAGLVAEDAVVRLAQAADFVSTALATSDSARTA